MPPGGVPLQQLIRAEISAEGPMNVERYMELCLGHPEHGYYMTRDPLGAAGDFTTAPEISQMFGELIGLWLVQAWLDQGAPEAFVLVELGPGRGTLMRDMLRAGCQHAKFAKARRVALIETSPVLRQIQQQTLAGTDAQWCAHVDELPALPVFCVANEFFDALPVRQEILHNACWQPRQITNTKEGLAFTLESAGAKIREVHAAGQGVMASLATRLRAQGGAVLIIDYGYWGPAEGDSLQALQKHRPVSPLAAPGEADLTTHVDFAQLAEVARKFNLPTAWTTQQDFLRSLGINERARRLIAANPAAADEISAAYARLTDVDQMGGLFKVLAVQGAGDETEGL